MSLNPSFSSPAPSSFHHQASTMFPKFMDGSFNGNSTSTNFSGGNTVRPKESVVSISTPTQPSAKLLDNWFNGNKTGVNVCPKGIVASSPDVRLMMPM
jgi:hypothetical protein|uniref:Uncharacterized protein n=1 Tax=viral metagenome TaxID=1070528 RepID=A0A6C0EUZ9_9ZZZZ